MPLECVKTAHSAFLSPGHAIPCPRTISRLNPYFSQCPKTGAFVPGHAWPLQSIRARQSLAMPGHCGRVNPCQQSASKEKQKAQGLAGQSVNGALAGLQNSPGQIVRGIVAGRLRFPGHKRGQTIAASAGPGSHRAANGRGRIYSPLQYMRIQYLAFVAPSMHGNRDFYALQTLHAASMALAGAIAASARAREYLFTGHCFSDCRIGFGFAMVG